MAFEYQSRRTRIIGIQALCRGYHTRTKGQFGRIYAIVHQQKLDEAEFKKQRKQNASEEAERLKRRRLAEASETYKEEMRRQEEENAEVK